MNKRINNEWSSWSDTSMSICYLISEFSEFFDIVSISFQIVSDD